MLALYVLGGAYQFGCHTFEIVAHHVVLLTGHFPKRSGTSISELTHHSFLELIAQLLGGKLVALFEYAIEACEIGYFLCHIYFNFDNLILSLNTFKLHSGQHSPSSFNG